MVTKPSMSILMVFVSYILAKNHMVTKLLRIGCSPMLGYILAKNHMVTKQLLDTRTEYMGYILAKNHMVTKPVGMD